MTTASIARRGIAWPAARLPRKRVGPNSKVLLFISRVALFSSDPWLAREAAALHVELCGKYPEVLEV